MHSPARKRIKLWSFFHKHKKIVKYTTSFTPLVGKVVRSVGVECNVFQGFRQLKKFKQHGP